MRRCDAFEHDRMMDALRTGLAPVFGTRAEWIDIAWDDADTDWSSFDAAIIGTAWDYWDRQDAFLEALERISGETHLYNSPELVRWNSHKNYLKDMALRGARTIPTVWLDPADTDNIRMAFDTLCTHDLVLKRQVGAGADGQVRLKAGEPIPAFAHPMMAQPFQEAILSEGEISFIFIDGGFSHALIKRAAAGDYRIQSTYGGTEQAFNPNTADLDEAYRIYQLIDGDPLYARIDMLRCGDGGLLLMEAELIEPYLYPLEGPELGQRIAKALFNRLA